MTQDWTARFLFPSGEISILSPEAVLSVPRALGFARRQDELAVFGMSEDGTGGLHFGSYETAWRHIREHGGLVSLTGEGGEVQLSVSRITGLLAGELEVVGDVALFDEIRVSASAQGLARVESVQRLITDGLCEMGTLMRRGLPGGLRINSSNTTFPFRYICASRLASRYLSVFPGVWPTFDLR